MSSWVSIRVHRIGMGMTKAELDEMIQCLDEQQRLLTKDVESQSKQDTQRLFLVYGIAQHLKMMVLRAKLPVSTLSPSGNYCSICNIHDQWCEHIPGKQ